MRAFQLIVAVIAALMTLGMFGFNIWINSRFAVSEAAKCYMPMNVTTTVLVLITVLTVFIRK